MGLCAALQSGTDVPIFDLEFGYSTLGLTGNPVCRCAISGLSHPVMTLTYFPFDLLKPQLQMDSKPLPMAGIMKINYSEILGLKQGIQEAHKHLWSYSF